VDRPLLIATAGGHLTQLSALAPRLGIDTDAACWVTTDTAQSRSLLAGRDVVWAPYSTPRDPAGLARNAWLARRVLASGPWSVVVSTGASLAPPFLAAARAHRVPAHYIESATRVDGPSLAGRMVSRIPGVRLYSQYQSWATARWKYRGSVLDGFQLRRREEPEEIRRVLVTVGSARGYPFTALLDAVRRVLPAGCDVTWQVSDADGTDLPGRVVTSLPAAEMTYLLGQVDVVVSHAGTGSVLSALQAGRMPVVVPRAARRGEHVDDHQSEIAAMLRERGLAVVREPAELSAADLRTAAGHEAVATGAVPYCLS
jgi:UDP-N-acetylglucosamine transferase subunit ALG13